MTLCGEPHPELEDVLCDKAAPCWVYHANAGSQAVWDGLPMPVTAPEPRASGRASVKAQLAMMASRAR